MKQANPFAASNTCDWCERPAIKSAGTDGAFLPRFHLCALHAAAPKLLAALEEIYDASYDSHTRHVAHAAIMEANK